MPCFICNHFVSCARYRRTPEWTRDCKTGWTTFLHYECRTLYALRPNRQSFEDSAALIYKANRQAIEDSVAKQDSATDYDHGDRFRPVKIVSVVTDGNPIPKRIHCHYRPPTPAPDTDLGWEFYKNKMPGSRGGSSATEQKTPARAG